VLLPRTAAAPAHLTRSSQRQGDDAGNDGRHASEAARRIRLAEKAQAQDGSEEDADLAGGRHVADRRERVRDKHEQVRAGAEHADDDQCAPLLRHDRSDFRAAGSRAEGEWRHHQHAREL
jgi:hypothetical protein